MRIFLLTLLLLSVCIYAQAGSDPAERSFPLDSVSGLKLINVKADVIEHDGRTGIKISKIDGEIRGETLVLIPESNFRDGTITVELTGEPAADADPQMRGFVGVAFRVDPEDHSSYECFYLRPANSRAEDQMRRNHTTQYVSHPEYPWYRMRQEFPGLYESYADLQPGKWTKVKIEVTGKTARLYLHGADQPCLVVNDLKHGETEGMIALWLHSSTSARFRNLVLTPGTGGTQGTSGGEETMNQADQDRRINYIEFLTTDMEATKKFYSELFGWEFTDYGPDYSSFSDGRMFGGFVVAEEVATVGYPLIVLFSTDLEGIRDRVVESGGKVVQDIFEFPGGQRFHFTDPSGNELAIWAE